MPLETATYISDLVPTNPAHTDQLNQDDSHMRLVKSTLKTTFPNITGAVTVTQAQINTVCAVGHPWATADYADLSVTTDKMADGGVTTVKLNNSSVTYPKMQNVTADRLLGNPTGTAAAPSEISLGSGLAFSGSALGLDPVTYALMQNVSANALLGNPTGTAAAPSEITLGVGLAFTGTTLKFTGANPASRVSSFVAKNNVSAPATKMDLTADAAVLVDATGAAVKHLSVSVTVDSTVTGANGCDVGTRAANTSYDIYLISNGTTIAGLYVIEGASPTLPAGYTFKKKVGWQRTDGSSNFKNLSQRGEAVRYALPQMLATGNAGNITAPTWAAVSLTNFLPASSTHYTITASQGGGFIMVAPNNGYGNHTTGTSNPPPIVLNIASGTIINQTAEFVLESTNVYWVNSDSAGAGGLACNGFRLPL